MKESAKGRFFENKKKSKEKINKNSVEGTDGYISQLLDWISLGANSVIIPHMED